MSDLQVTLTILVFAGVILAIAFNVIDLAVAALLGVSIMLLFGAFTRQEFLNAAQTAGGSIALLFGGMVVARTLVPTGIFEIVGVRFLRATGGSGKRFLLGLIVLVAPLCAFLPNATTVILLAPIIIRVAKALKIDFVGPLVLTAIISNSAGLLTLVGASANVVSAGISAAHGRPISFATFARYGIPLTLCQLVLSSVYVLFISALDDRALTVAASSLNSERVWCGMVRSRASAEDKTAQ